MKITFLVFLVATSLTAQTGANVLLVANRQSEDSKAIAAYYARLRAVPASNLCWIDTPAIETVSRAVYDSAIAKPVRACLESRKLVESTLYVVTTLGVPLRIDGAGGMQGDLAAVDSELTMLYAVIHGLTYALNGGYRNPFFQAIHSGSEELARTTEPPREAAGRVPHSTGGRGGPVRGFDHRRYPMYMVTRLAAYNRAGVFAMLDRSQQAFNRGKFVIDLLETDKTDGNSWLEAAVKLLPADRVVVDRTAKVLTDRMDVIGYASWGSNDPARKERFLHFRWLPGAIMTEYVSTNGRTFQRPPDSWKLGAGWKEHDKLWARSPQSLIADYLLEGVTGAGGHVYEPYLVACPRPDLLLPEYFRGRNLAESYYVSIPWLSWQNVVVGDPLCRLR